MTCFNGNIPQLVTAVDAIQCVYIGCGSSCVGGNATEPPLSFGEAPASFEQAPASGDSEQ
jgi:hypothetical protein